MLIKQVKSTVLSPVHTKNVNYKDNDISVHTSERYLLFILSTRASAALNSRAHYSRMDSDCLSVFYHSSAGNKIVLEVIPTISFRCAFIVIVVVWTLLFFSTENDFQNYIFIVIVLGVNGPLGL